MKTLPRFGFVAVAAALLLAGCGGGAASESTATPRPGETATATRMPGTTAGASPSLPVPTASLTLTALAQTPSPATSATASALATGAPAATAVAMSWAPASTTPCQPEGARSGNRMFANLDQHVRNLRCAVDLFGWPPGRYPDLDRLVANLFDLATREGEPRFEVGFEFATLTKLNQCAWYFTWLEARQSGNTAAEAEALDVMVRIIPNYFMIVPGIPADLQGPDVTHVAQEIATRASLGDPSLVQQYVESNCQNMPWKAAS